MDQTSFSDASEELQFWKQKAEEYRQSLEKLHDEFEEFRFDSRELELELDTEVQQLVQRNNELLSANEKLILDRDKFRNLAECDQNKTNRELSDIQSELNRLRQDHEELQRYVRKLEQINDDFERANRNAEVSLDDFKLRLNQAIEKNAILETELGEKDDLVVTVERLREETRDLQQELAVAGRPPATNGTISTCKLRPNSISISKMCKEVQTVFVETDPLLCPLLTPTVRATALKMVNDALNKIGQLEQRISFLYRSQNVPYMSAPHSAVLNSPIYSKFDKGAVTSCETKHHPKQQRFQFSRLLPFDHTPTHQPTSGAGLTHNPVRTPH